MNGKVHPGSIMVRINNKFYEVPENALLFKSYDDKDVYLSGIRNEGIPPKYIWIGTVKFIEENRFDDVPLELLGEFMLDSYKKFVVDDEEYDIPIRMLYDFKQRTLKFSKHFPHLLREFKELYKDYLFKSNLK